MNQQNYPEPPREPMTERDRAILIGMLVASASISIGLMIGVYKLATFIFS